MCDIEKDARDIINNLKDLDKSVWDEHIGAWSNSIADEYRKEFELGDDYEKELINEVYNMLNKEA